MLSMNSQLKPSRIMVCTYVLVVFTAKGTSLVTTSYKCTYCSDVFERQRFDHTTENILYYCTSMKQCCARAECEILFYKRR